MGDGVDIAILGLQVDARQFVQADAVLDDFVETSGRAEQAAKGVTAATAGAGKAAQERAAAEKQLAETVAAANQATAEQAAQATAAAEAERARAAAVADTAKAAREATAADQDRAAAAAETAKAASVAAAADKAREGAAASAAEAATKQARAAEAAAEASKRAAADLEAHNRRILASIARADEDHRAKREAAEQADIQRAAANAEARAQAVVKALEARFQQDIALIKEAQLRGFLTPQEAAEQGRMAGQSFNSALLPELDKLRAATGQEISPAIATMAGSIKNVDEAGRSASLGVGRLNQGLQALLRQATGTSPVVGSLANVIGSLAIGATMMTGVLAGLAALSLAWRKLTEDAREARDAQQEALRSLERMLELRRTEALGPGGVIGEDLETARGDLERIQREIDRTRQLRPLAGLPGGPGTFAMDARLRALQEEYDRSADIIQRGEQELTRLRREGIAEGIRADIDAASERRTARLDALGGLAAGPISDAEREAAKLALRLREIKAIAQEMQGLTPDILKIGSETHQARDPGSILATGYVAASKASRDYEENAKEAMEKARIEAERAADATREAWVSALQNVGRAFGGVVDQAIALATAVASIPDLNKAGALSGAAKLSIAGAVGGFVGSMLGSERNDEARLRQSIRDWENALDDFVGTLTDRTRLEQLRQGFEDQLTQLLQDALNNSIRSAIHEGAGGLEVSDMIKQRDFLLAIADTQGVDAAVEAAKALGPEFHALAKAMQQAKKDAEEWRQEQVAGLTENVQVRVLRAQGLDAEADALQRTYDREKELTQARELEDKALEDLLVKTHAMEDAAIALAAAVAEASRAFDEHILNLEIDAGMAGLAGNDQGAAEINAQIQRDRDTNRANQMLADKDISLDTYNRWIDYINLTFSTSMETAAQATLDAAAAEAELTAQRQFSEMQSIRNLDVQILRLQGRDQEALDLQQLIELDNALSEGRSQLYIDTLNLLHAEQDRVLATRLQAQAQHDTTRAVQETTRELNRMVTALNAPAAFNLAGFRNSSLGQSATVTVGNMILNFGGYSGDPREIAAAVEQEFDRMIGAGYPNPYFGSTGG